MGIGETLPAYMVMARIEGATPMFLFETDEEAAEWALSQDRQDGVKRRLWQVKVKVGAELTPVLPIRATLRVLRTEDLMMRTDPVDVSSGRFVTRVPGRTWTEE